MEDPLSYREHPQQDPAVEARRQAQRAMLTGLAIFALSSAVASVPLLWGRWGLNKYFVIVGLIGVLWGLSAILHGIWDWWVGRE